MSAFSPNARRQRSWLAQAKKQLARLGDMKASPDAKRAYDALREAIDAGPPSLHVREQAPERSARADRRAKRARRHEAVKAMFKAAGVALPKEKNA